MPESSGVFREEALRGLNQGRAVDGQVLRISPVWTIWMYWVVLASLTFAVAFCFIARIDEYASGPAVVRVEGGTWIEAYLPGRHRLLLEQGQRIRLELDGYPYLRQELILTHVGEEVMGPHEARRLLGADLEEAAEIRGPVVVVRAELPDAATFVVDGQDLRYHDRMIGRVEGVVRTTSIAATFMPWFRALLGHATSDI